MVDRPLAILSASPSDLRRDRSARCKLVRRRPLVAAMAAVVSVCAGSSSSTAVTAFVSSGPSSLHVTPGWHPPRASPTPSHQQTHYHQHHHHASTNLHTHHGVSLTAKERPVGSSAPLPKRKKAGERGGAAGGGKGTPRNDGNERRRMRVRRKAAAVDTQAERERVEDVDRGSYGRGMSANSRYPMSFNDFLDEIHKIDRITPEQEVALSDLIQRALSVSSASGFKETLKTQLNRSPTFEEVAAYAELYGTDQDRAVLAAGLRARSTLVTANLRLVQVALYKVTKRGNFHVSPADLMQEGVIGLIRAAEKFDASKGFRFSTYATIWIRSSIARCVRQDSSGGSVVVPQKVLALKDRINKYRRTCMVEKGYMIEPSREEIAHALDVPLEKVQQCMNRAYSTEMKECDDSMQFHKAVNGRADRSDVQLAMMYANDFSNEVQRFLSDQEWESLQLRYGLTDEHVPHTVPEVAELMEMNTAAAHRMLKGAVRKLQTDSIKERLSSYLEDF